MNKRFTGFLLIILLLLATGLIPMLYLSGLKTSVPVTASSRPTIGRILLVPLDSRPPCTQFVQELGHLADYEVVIPPPELLGEYRTPGHRAELIVWLKQNISGADAAILSMDMLIHGGLVASRQSAGTPEDTAAAIALLEDLHQLNPKAELYPFSIIPRLLLADTPANTIWQRQMLQYSVLKDKAATFENPRDLDKLAAMRSQIPEDIIARYQEMYDRNYQLNFSLLQLTARGITSGLVIGQDDGQPFGMPNMIKQKLSKIVESTPALSGKAFITRGTDEVALTLMGHIANHKAGYSPRIYVKYSSPSAPDTVMPYMPNTVARTVFEKTELVGGKIVDDPAQADLYLYVHIGSKRTSDEVLTAAAQIVSEWIKQDKPVAVVDLSEDFTTDCGLLPALLREDVPIARLAAYAGWNTTSNSVGTAVVQGLLFAQSLRQTASVEEEVSLYHTQLTFLAERFLDDWFYEKDVQGYINNRLKAMNINPYDLGGTRNDTARMAERLLRDKAAGLFSSNLSKTRIPLRIGEGHSSLVINDLSLHASLPWERTFEVKIQPRIVLAIVKE